MTRHLTTDKQLWLFFTLIFQTMEAQQKKRSFNIEFKLKVVIINSCYLQKQNPWKNSHLLIVLCEIAANVTSVSQQMRNQINAYNTAMAVIPGGCNKIHPRPLCLLMLNVKIN